MTSTEFYHIYLDHYMVECAAESDGQLHLEIAEYIVDADNPLEIKVAVINALGWENVDWKNIYCFKDVLFDYRGYQTFNEFLECASADELVCYGYVFAMNTIRAPLSALSFVKRSLVLEPLNPITNLIYTIIYSQHCMLVGKDYLIEVQCDLYQNTQFRTEGLLEGAERFIFGYLGLYS